MWCKINAIEKNISYKGDEVLIIKFVYDTSQKYTKLSKSALEYWKKYRKIEEFKIGQEINVIEKFNEKYNKMLYKIIEVK